MTKKEIRKQYRMNKKTLKRSYKRHKTLIQNQYVQNLDNYYEQKGGRPSINPPYRSVLEEIGNAVTHGLGSLFSIVAFILMLAQSHTTQEYIGASVYFIGLFLMFTMSTLYHCFPYGSKVKRIFRRFDYSSIYLLIGATFAPILLCYIGGTIGTLFFIVQWIIIITGITFIAIFGPTRLKFIHFPLYILLGWSGLFFLPNMIKHDIVLFGYILSGGIVYTLGIIPFVIDKKVSHFIWHIFVMIGALVQWLGIYLCLYLG